MAKKKKKGAKKASKAAARSGAATVKPPPPPKPPPRAVWPEDFPSPTAVLCVSIVVFALGVSLFYNGAFNNLLWLKKVFAYLAGMPNPTFLPQPAQSFSIMVVLIGFLLIVGGAFLHPALGLAMLFMMRPWLDGNTFPAGNLYFIWGVILMLVLWGVRMVMRGGEIRFGRPILLLAAFVALLALSAASSIHLGRTFRGLILWYSYLGIFMLVSNTLRSKAALGVLQTAIVLTVAAEALYAILSLAYILPATRAMVEDPRLLMEFFGEEVINPEIKHRLEMNRVFGTLLFPNALAAFLILSLPFCAVGAVLSLRPFEESWESALASPLSAKQGLKRRRPAFYAGAAAWLGGTILAMMLLFFPAADPNSFLGALLHDKYLRFFAASAVLGLVPMAVFAWLTYRGGLLLAGRFLRCAGFFVATALQGYALWLTYSRGGMLALAAACVIGAALFLLRPAMLPPFLKRGLPAAKAALLLGAPAALLLGLMLTSVPQALAQPEQNQPGQNQTGQNQTGQNQTGQAAPPQGASETPGTALSREGIDVTAQQLISTATVSLRLSYWKVGLDMFRRHFWGGVGLGNFGIAYPTYQYLGAGDVREAHNGYLQFFCESGVFGGLAFLAFWGYFVGWGILRILREEDRRERLIFTGLFTGILAFLIHSFIDINFSAPTLCMFIMMFAGLFCARVSLSQDTGAAAAPPKARVSHQICMLGLLVLSALVLGFSTRVYLHDFNLSRGALVGTSSRKEADLRYNAAKFFLRKEQPPNIRALDALAIISGRERIQAIGPLYTRFSTASNGVRRVTPQEPLPLNALLVVTDAEKGFAYAREGAEAWADELALHINTIFPYEPEDAYAIAELYKLLFDTAPEEEAGQRRLGHLKQYVRWAEEAVRRGPMQADNRGFYADALRDLGNHGGDARNQMKHFNAAVAEYRAAAIHAPNLPYYQWLHAGALENLSKAYAALGDAEMARRLNEEMLGVKDRLEAVRAALAAEGAEAFFSLSPPANEYLAGFHGSASALIITAEHALFLCDFRYIEKARAAVHGYDVLEVKGTLETRLGERLKALGAASAAFDPVVLSVYQLGVVERAFGGALKPLPDIVSGLRELKSPEEIDKIRAASELAEDVMLDVLGELKPGIQEREFAALLEYEFKKRGAEASSFAPMALFGPNSSLPHGTPGEKCLEEGDIVLLDLGCIRESYCSDLTRCYVFGRIVGAWFEKIYQVTLAAQLAALETLQPGRPCREVDAAARDIIRDAGFGEHFGHGLGHGVGLEVHEAPRLNMESEAVLAPGMVVTIEPGIYLPGQGGVRIEDLVVITETGYDLLTRSPKQLQVLGL